MFKEKDPEYYLSERRELIEYVSAGPNRILEIGAAKGATGEALKREGKAAEVVGVELFEEAARVAASRIDRIIVGDIETMTLDYPDGHFHYVICGDVLEHLRSPWDVLTKLRPLIADNGKVIASIPNVRYKQVVKDLVLRGEFRYETQGILDSTHLRFFTRNSIRRLFKEAGYTIETIAPIYLKKGGGKFNRFTLKLFDDFHIYQYIVVARKER